MTEHLHKPQRSDKTAPSEGASTPPNAEKVPVLDVELLPEVVSELAAASEQHEQQLSELAGVVSELGGISATLRDEVHSLREYIVELQDSLVQRANLNRPNRWAWKFLTHDEAAQLWSELRWFVDYFIERYPLSLDVSIPSCWYRHTVAVDELTDLYAAWREAYCSIDQPSDAMTAWRNRWLWPTLHTLHSHADWRECKAQRQHVESAARQHATDGEFDDFMMQDLRARTGSRRSDLPWHAAGTSQLRR
ncbi:hypothetical protein [Lentzea jiangxiensis]|uniref:DUF4913 domain-containing protein n=1 Tax=Lentzea jiangxiensis TaxID=641025 RepID=A0A1H0X4R3_9PSEU|nr:hypothetical protein [Lentzea jiangxiensis]SDP97819.1 hypothetical protein SAMN05421507_13414 [Lentzea jiangxiensis]